MKKKGFTLVELIAVITILSVLIVIAAPNIVKLMGNNKEDALESVKQLIITAGRNYAVDYDITGPYTISVAKLCNTNYLECPINNPVTETPMDGKVRVNDNNRFEYVDAYECTYEGSLANNASYINGQYTYTYKTSYEGWTVTLTDKDSTDPVNTELCAYVSGKPIISMQGMFDHSKTTSINLSSFDTSNVANMALMFRSVNLDSLDLSGFDTSKVTNMTGMFAYSSFKTLDPSYLDTSNVTNMKAMFRNVMYLDSLDLSTFNTSKVIDMSDMFASTDLTSINVSSFDTSKVTNMNSMFLNTGIKALDLSSFDTSSLSSNPGIFGSSHADRVPRTCYVRSQADLDKLSSDALVNTTFIIK